MATDVALTPAQAKRVAVMAQDGLARAIRPIHAPFDGDVVFALSTARRPLPEAADYTVARHRRAGRRLPGQGRGARGVRGHGLARNRRPLLARPAEIAGWSCAFRAASVDRGHLREAWMGRWGKLALCAGVAGIAGAAFAQPAGQKVTGPVATYWMSAATQSGFGMPGAGGGGGRPSASQIMAMMRGGGAAQHTLTLQLGFPQGASGARGRAPAAAGPGRGPEPAAADAAGPASARRRHARRSRASTRSPRAGC